MVSWNFHVKLFEPLSRSSLLRILSLLGNDLLHTSDVSVLEVLLHSPYLKTKTDISC